MHRLMRYRLLSLFALLGAVISLVLVYHHALITSGLEHGPSFCSLGEGVDCDVVARSEFSQLFGIPVASFALLYYLILLVTVQLAAPRDSREEHEIADLLFFLALCGAVPTVVFAAISAFILKTLCLMCAGLYVTALGALLCAWQLPGRSGLVSAVLNGAGAARDRLRPTHGIHARLSLLLLGSTALAVLFLPSYLELEVLFPRARAAKMNEATAQAVAAWAQAPTKEIEVAASGAPSEKDFILGSIAAPVTMVIFSDFECPFCKRAAEALHSLEGELRRQVRIVFKNYPLDQACHPMINRPMHQFACRAALIARCAGAQDDELFWAAHDALFAQELSPETLDALPAELGLDAAQFELCMRSPEQAQKLRRDIEQGISLDIRGTPTVYLNGRLLQPATPEVLEQAIRRALDAD